MKRCLVFIVLILVCRMSTAGVQPADMAAHIIGVINKKINDVNDPLQDITSRLSFQLTHLLQPLAPHQRG